MACVLINETWHVPITPLDTKRRPMTGMTYHSEAVTLKVPSMAVYSCNSRTWKAEAGGLLWIETTLSYIMSFRAASATE